MRWLQTCPVRLLVALALIASAMLTTAGDWPTSLHDPQRTARSPDETIVATSNAAQLTKLWSFATGGPVAASAAIVGSTVYVGSWDGYEYALDAGTGAQKWRTYLGVTNANPICFPASAGVSSAATVLNGVVYVGGGDAYWYALDATTGSVLWNVYTGDNSPTGGHYNWSSPLIYNGYAYIGISSMGDCPLVQGQLLQVSLSSHQVVNTFNVVPAGQVGGGIWTSPSVDPVSSTIFVNTGTINDPSQAYAQSIVALDAATLALKSSWRIPQSQAVFDSDFGTSVTLFNDAQGNPLAAATNKNGYTYAFNRNNLSAGPVWQRQIAYGGGNATEGDGSVSSAAFGNGALYAAGGNTTIDGVGYPGGVRAIDPTTGNFLWQRGLASPVVPALAYANGLLLVGTGPTLEVLHATSGAALYTFTTGATIYAAPSVANGRLIVSSTDGTVYAFSLPASVPPPPPPDPNCPSGWSCQDIGNPLPAGSESVSGGLWKVTAGGAGIAATSDQFRLISRGLAGDSQIVARVVSQQSTSSTAQGGLMLRQSAAPDSPYYAVLLTSPNKLVVQYRSAWGGATTVANQVAAGSLPFYLEIQRYGDRLQAATSTDGNTFRLVPGGTVTLVMPTTIVAGLVVSSDVNGTAWMTSYGNVATAPLGTSPMPTGTGCTSGWNCADIGDPALVGSQTLSNGTWTVRGGGADILDYADQFHFVWKPQSADATLSARVGSQTSTSAGAKAGVMLRQSIDPGALYYAVFITPSDGIVVQYRSNEGLRSTIVTTISGTVPTYLKVARSGNTYSAYTSGDGATWSYVIGTSVALSTSGTVLAGLAVSSHNTAALSSATFDTLKVNGSAPPPPPACPSGWTCADIGNPTPVGSQVLSNGTWTIQGGGGDIWSTADEFHFVWQALAADGMLSARVVSQTNTDAWAKTGIMLRQTSDPSAAYYFAFVTPSNGINVQYRASQGAVAASLASIPGTVPAYLRVARSGNTYSAYTSSDGVTWTYVSGTSVTLSTSGALLAGLAVTSHNTTALSTATFDTFAIGAAATPSAQSSTLPQAQPTTTSTPIPTGTPTRTSGRRATPTAVPLATALRRVNNEL